MFKTIRAIGFGLALAGAPLAASALTVDPGSNVANGGSYDIFAGPFFYSISFRKLDNAGSFKFTFFNNGPKANAITTSFATVLQGTLKFAGGVNASWANGTSAFVPEAQPTGGFGITTIIKPGQSDTLKVVYGDPQLGRKGGTANIDLSISTAPVPLPASGLLLVAGLGGIALLRRRRKPA